MPHRATRFLIVAVALIAIIGVAAFSHPFSALADSYVPSAEIVGLPSYVDCTGGNYPVPVQYNMPFTTRIVGSMVVDGVGVVSSYDQDVSRTDLGVYSFNSAVFNVPSGTRITMTITTYAAVAPSTDVEYQSSIVFECGTGKLISLNGALTSSGPGPDMVYIPEYAVVGSFTASTPLYFDDNANAATSHVMEAGKTLWVFGINAEGTYYQVLLNGVNYWVPVGTMGPNYDEVWNGTPLPTEVVE